MGKKISIVLIFLIVLLVLGGCIPSTTKPSPISEKKNTSSLETSIETEVNPCRSITCNTNEKCVDGDCILKTCSEMGGIVCSGNKECSDTEVESLDTPECCKDSCNTIDPCKDITCDGTQKCVDGDCILKTCSEMGGYICYEDLDEECSTGFISSFDSSMCCKVKCTRATTTNPCKGIVCEKPTQSCINGKCEWTSCNDANGEICDINTESCSTGKYEISLEGADPGEPSSWSKFCCIGDCIKSQYDISLSGPLKITSKTGAGLSCGSWATVELLVSSTFSETASLGAYEVYIDDKLTYGWSPLNVEPGTNKFYADLDWAKDLESFEKIKIVFNCGKVDKFKEATCENNVIEETLNYQKIDC